MGYEILLALNMVPKNLFNQHVSNIHYTYRFDFHDRLVDIPFQDKGIC